MSKKERPCVFECGSKCSDSFSSRIFISLISRKKSGNKPPTQTEMSRILDSVLEAVGQTPIVRLGGINDTGKEILVKLEYLNPSGSIKDRVAVQTLNDLEAQGRLNGVSLVAHVSGRHCDRIEYWEHCDCSRDGCSSASVSLHCIHAA